MSIEIIKDTCLQKGQIKAAIFDFDGTISTLRRGWEKVMAPLMVEFIKGGTEDYKGQIERLVDEYIDASTGIQTIYQMRWLVKQIKKHGFNQELHDEWWYKNEYNKRLMENVNRLVNKVVEDPSEINNYTIRGSRKFLETLKNRGISLYAASGTDHADVHNEIKALGLFGIFDIIKGAPERKASCPKEAVMKMIIEEQNLQGNELVVIGDGKVEITLGIEYGAYTLGIASNEDIGYGINPIKRKRLIDAGVHAIVGDFVQSRDTLDLLGIPD